jgi:glycosyltransferase involved in cell wall biosynthesis
MEKQQNQTGQKTLLVFNCHEAWIYQLGVLGYKLDIIVGLKGQYKKSWDEQMRPIPAQSRLISLSEALQSKSEYYCIITHNIADLLDIKTRSEPRLMVIHSTIEGRKIEEKSDIEPEKMKQMLHKYLNLVGGHTVAISLLKGRSWDLEEDIIPSFADPDDYPAYSGHISCGLRICNFIENRKKILQWDLHKKAFDGLAVKLVGHNPSMPGVSAAKNWDDLKKILQSHRFYIHTAEPNLEDGYNMASLEAMAAGMPVLGNRHPTSPIKHGVSGFLSDDPVELRKYATILLENRDLAVRMGRAGRKTILEHFSKHRFKESFLRSIETAREKSKGRLINTGEFSV